MKGSCFTCSLAAKAMVALALFAFLVLASLAPNSAVAQEKAPAPDLASSAQTAYLDYTELAQSPVMWGLSLTRQTAPFKKEPTLGDQKVIRGVFKFGNNADQFISFIWDQKQSKLYLDLNRNQDLSDDAAGVFSALGRSSFSNYSQSFTNIHLSFPTSVGSCPSLVDLHLYQYGNNQLSVSVACRSIWQGKVSLQGREWQIGVVENIIGKIGSAEGGYLVLRPWQDRQKALVLQDGSLDGFSFAHQLFFGNKGYRLDSAWVQPQGSLKCKLSIQEQTPALGEVKLTGKFIKRLILSSSQYTAVLDRPGTLARIPVGSYGRSQVELENGALRASLQAAGFPPPSSKEAVVNATTPAVIDAGGPLTNQVSAVRRSDSLNLNYRLVGPGGETYQLIGGRAQPGFAIYRGGRKVDSGKFEFG